MFFFFQAEDGIRDYKVTGVQTCALPISLPERSVFLLSFDFDPSSKPELEPQAVALLRHAFRKNLRVIGMTHWLTGTGLADDIFSRVAAEMGRERGKDYEIGRASCRERV